MSAPVKFCLVGCAGTIVQAIALWLLSNWTRNYLLASTAALELTLIHNFCWHVRYTWRGCGEEGKLIQCARFHASSGTVSMAGNFILLPVLIEMAHCPKAAAHAIAILCCGAVNYRLGTGWCFRPDR